VKIHQKYIKRCIALAKNGLGTTYPNPLVGCVIVYNDQIIGEGWHQKAGESHAEVNAINSVKNKELLSKSTIYVSLEPCSHFGKTPPCADLIIKNNIPNIVIGSLDSNEKVSGRGVKKLIEAGRNVTIGVLEDECKALNKRFFTFHEKKRPYIILKWAESSDGFIAPLNKQTNAPIWISNEYSRQITHKWRSEEQAIFVGTQTVLDDNPKLDTRDWYGKNPIRIVLDRSGKINTSFNVFDKSIPTIIVTEQKNLQSTDNLIFKNCIFESELAQTICKIGFNFNIQSIIIEGGTQTIQTFLNEELWDEARIFKGKSKLNEGIKAPKIDLSFSTRQSIINDELVTLYAYDHNNTF
jgi:diaminohydroxyphosphoribosylaminopyrimidine deaminase/5-amino-6-(5-phosphoribosylamino)uracil reductase